MKPYLFYIWILFPFGPAICQVGGNVNNSNNNSNSNSINIEELSPAQLEPKKAKESTESVEEESVSSPATAISTEIQSQVSLDSQRANYLSNYTAFNQQRNQRSLTEGQKEVMVDLLRNLASSYPESFESYFFYYLNGQNDLSRSKALLKAKEMNPKDESLQKEMMTYYVLLNKKDETRKALLDLSQNKVYPSSTEAYGEDLINSAPINSTLITHGKEDSYAALYAQNVKREREDVQILSLEWLNSPQYRSKLKLEGWVLPASEFINTAYLEELCALNSHKKIAISLTLPKEYLLPIIDKLYISGLVFEYKEIPTDMTVRNEELWYKELNKELISTLSNDLVNNYLPMIFQLRKVYESNGEADKVEQLDEIIKEITTR